MNRGSHRFRAWIAAAGVSAAAFVCGCDSKGLIPVAGRVTIAGRSPPGGGYVYFVPRDMSTNLKRDRSGPRPGTALLAADGSFRASTFEPADGLRPGSYEVRLECAVESAPRQVDATTHDTPSTSAIPAGFTAPDLVVPTSGPSPVRYDVDVR